MESRWNELKKRLTEIYDLRAVMYLLSWDQSTYMPEGGSAARGRQLALLESLNHEKLTDPAIGRLLEALQSEVDSLPDDSDEASLIRVARKEYERAIRVPSQFMAEAMNHFSDTYQVWTQARPANDFAMVLPYLEKTLDYSRRYAEYFDYDHIADPLIDGFASEGLKTETIRRLFADLRKELVPLVKQVTAKEPLDDSCLRQPFPEQQQWDFGVKVIRQLGYDFNRGRQDKAPHPFMTKFSIGDVRITTRLKEDYLAECLFSTIHEAGHALYEQGIRADLEGTPLAYGASSGVHESQSRLWENIVGRSRGFWEHFYPQLQAVFPEQLKEVSLDTFYRAINKVEPSLIRTDADELTYNLHVMIRFDLELEMLEGKLAVKDLPEAWRERYKSDLGVYDPGDRDGVLQDIHWYYSPIGGMFQGYALGNILSAQYYEAALKAHPEIPEQIRQGRFDTLHGWLKQNIYQHGAKFTPQELTERVTGSPLSIEPYMRYLRNKFGELYSL